MLQSVAFVADRKGKSIAYASVGRGRPLVCDTGFISHLEAQWEYAPYRRFFEALAHSHRVIRYDPPGIGLGDPLGEVVDLEDDVAVLEDLIDGLALGDCDLFGASQAAAVMIAYAARHPERVGRVVLFGGYANGAALSPPAVQEALLRLIEAHWGMASKTLADIFMRGADDAAQANWARTTRLAATPVAAVRRMRECFRTDVRPLLRQVAAPTLVLHRRSDVNVRVEHGVELAAGIPGAQLILLDGESHLWFVGDMESVLNRPRVPGRQAPAASSGCRAVATRTSGGRSDRRRAQQRRGGLAAPDFDQDSRGARRAHPGQAGLSVALANRCLVGGASGGRNR